MKESKLPINIPSIICYLHHAYPLGIISTRDTYLPWFHSNFIQLCCPVDFPTNREAQFNFYPPPWTFLHVETINQSIIEKYGFFDFLVDSINKGYYIRPTVNEYYMPDRYPYKQFNRDHELLIYGYDLDRKLFHTIGFNQKFIYTRSTIEYESLYSAYSSCERSHHTLLLKYDNQYNYNFDIHLVFDLITEYLQSKNSTFRNSMSSNKWGNHIFGIEVYNSLKSYLRLLLDKQTDFDIRPLQIIYEHKKCMFDRLVYMEHNQFLNKSSGLALSYAEIKEQGEIIRNSMIKAGINNDPTIISDIIQLLDTILEKEYVILQKVLENIAGKVTI